MSRLHSRRVSRATVIVALVLVAALAGCGGGGKKSESSYVAANTKLLKGNVPVYPTATLANQATTAYTTGGPKVAGYQTRYVYSLPAKASLSSVQAFYGKQMPKSGWQQVAALTGPVLNYRKGDAFVSVNMTPVRQHQLEVTVDQGFFSHLKK